MIHKIWNHGGPGKLVTRTLMSGLKAVAQLYRRVGFRVTEDLMDCEFNQ